MTRRTRFTYYINWISIKDLLPDSRNIVLASGRIPSNDHDTNSTMLATYHEGSWYALDHHLTEPDFFACEVDHWFPLPQAPKDGNQ